MARGEPHDLLAPAVEERIGGDEQRTRPRLGDVGEGPLDFGLIPGMKPRLSYRSPAPQSRIRARWRRPRRIRVQQHPDSGGRRNNIEQQPQALLGKLGAEDVDPGRIAAGPARLVTSPSLTGSVPVFDTIGIVAVASLAAEADVSPPTVTITVTRRDTRSAAKAGTRS